MKTMSKIHSTLDEWITGHYGDDDYPDDRPAYLCDDCEEPIWDGDPVWMIGNEVYCDECAQKLYRRLA